MFKLNQELPDYVISLRLAQLQQYYGGTRLLAGILALSKKRTNLGHPKDSPSVHLQNLCQTYGKESVISIYYSIYKLDNVSKIG